MAKVSGTCVCMTGCGAAPFAASRTARTKILALAKIGTRSSTMRHTSCASARHNSALISDKRLHQQIRDAAGWGVLHMRPVCPVHKRPIWVQGDWVSETSRDN